MRTKLSKSIERTMNEVGHIRLELLGTGRTVEGVGVESHMRKQLAVSGKLLLTMRTFHVVHHCLVILLVSIGSDVSRWHDEMIMLCLVDGNNTAHARILNMVPCVHEKV